MKRIFLYLVFCLLLSGTFLSSPGQTLSAELKDMSKGAELILTGKVTDQQSSWNEDHSRIFTRVTITVDEYIKGNNVGSTVVVKHPGGEVGEVGELYTHIPTFKNDEEVLLFLEKSRTQNEYRVFQGENGKMKIMTDKNTGNKITADRKSINSVKKQIRKYMIE